MREELVPILHNLFQNTEKERTHLNSLYELNVTLIKPDKDSTNKIKSHNNPHKCLCKNH